MVNGLNSKRTSLGGLLLLLFVEEVACFVILVFHVLERRIEQHLVQQILIQLDVEEMSDVMDGLDRIVFHLFVGDEQDVGVILV